MNVRRQGWQENRGPVRTFFVNLVSQMKNLSSLLSILLFCIVAFYKANHPLQIHDAVIKHDV